MSTTPASTFLEEGDLFERRLKARTIINRGALLFFAGHVGVHSCCVRDVTNDGAGIRLSGLNIVPSEFGISFDNFRTMRITLAHARVAAEADLELQRIRHLKVAMHERVKAYGDFDGPKLFQSDKEELRWMKANIQWLAGRGPLKLPWPAVVDPLAAMPKEEPHRSAEATRRLLPEFIKLLRYEKRATGRRDRAIRKMMCDRQTSGESARWTRPRFG